jgi:hypothetical protein
MLPRKPLEEHENLTMGFHSYKGVIDIWATEFLEAVKIYSQGSERFVCIAAGEAEPFDKVFPIQPECRI